VIAPEAADCAVAEARLPADPIHPDKAKDERIRVKKSGVFSTCVLLKRWNIRM
jgi:hypothetical protein